MVACPFLFAAHESRNKMTDNNKSKISIRALRTVAEAFDRLYEDTNDAEASVSSIYACSHICALSNPFLQTCAVTLG
jgi:hypothetical protein